jgi:plastocyanin
MRAKRVLLATLLVVITVGGSAGLAVAKAGGGGEPTRANVVLKEFRFIGLKKNYEPGMYTFTFRNTGQFPHNLTVLYVSQGKKFKTRTIDPGKSQELTINLRPGSYVVGCTVFNGFHISQGMVGRFTVGKIDLNTGEWG